VRADQSDARMRRATITLTVCGLFLAASAEAQPPPPTALDLSASYCLRVAAFEKQELEAIIGPCDAASGEARQLCVGALQESEAQIQRLRAYLAARGYLPSGPMAHAVAGLSIAQTRASQDLNVCRGDPNRCTHCLRQGQADRGLIEADMGVIQACVRQCHAAVPACVRIRRCGGGDFLAGIP
jgi:ferredoxin